MRSLVPYDCGDPNRYDCRAYDYGDSKSPLGNIHPEYKAPVGQRLAWGARALAYGEKIPYKNPTLVSATMGTAADATTITLKFSVPVEIRHGHVGFFDASIKTDSKAWLSVNGVNATQIKTNAAGEVEVAIPTSALMPSHKQTAANMAEDVATALSASLEYLQGDWPVPIFYAKGSDVPGLPAAPFVTTAATFSNTAL